MGVRRVRKGSLKSRFMANEPNQLGEGQATGRRHRHIGLWQIRIDCHVEARRSPFNAAQHQVLHCIEAGCSTRDGVAHPLSDGCQTHRPQ